MGRDRLVKQVAGDFFKRWMCDSKHEIFRAFIEHERNNLLKEYRSDVHPLEGVQGVTKSGAIAAVRYW
jgi:hypothetical protein